MNEMVGIIGHFGEKNFGDELMLKMFINGLLDMNENLNFLVLSNDPEFSRIEYSTGNINIKT